MQVGVQIPILDWGKRRGKVRVAKSNRDVVLSKIRQEQINFNQDIFLLVEHFNNQAQQLAIAKEADGIAQQRYKTSIETFLIGKIKRKSSIPMVRHLRVMNDPLSKDQEELLSTEQRANQLSLTVIGLKFHKFIKDDQIIIKESVKKSDCEKKAAELAEKGFSFIFSVNPEFESVLEEAAQKYPKVQFCQEGGKLAKDSELSNFHNYDTRIYEAYHVAGLVAGIKLNHLLDKVDISAEDCVIGFVAYEKNAKTTSCINAYYLGVERD